MNAPENHLTATWTVLKPESESWELAELTMAAPKYILVNTACHQGTSKSMLEKLSYHESQDVRTAVGENPNTPLEILRRLACDENPDVRYCLAENHNMYMEILRILISDENPYVAARAQRTVDRIRPRKTTPTFSCPITAQRLVAFVACA